VTVFDGISFHINWFIDDSSRFPFAMENPFPKNLNIINVLEILLEFLLDKPREVNKEYSSLREFTLPGGGSSRKEMIECGAYEDALPVGRDVFREKD
jgi:hypothetical protein